MRSKCNHLFEMGSKMFLHFLFLLALVFAVTLAVSETANAEEPWVNVDQTVLQDNHGQFPAVESNDKYYKLTGDIVISNSWNIQGNTTLDLNGYGIMMHFQSLAGVITVGTNTTLTIQDSNKSSTHYIKLDNWRGAEVADKGEETVLNNGTGTMKVSGGYITGGAGKTDSVNVGGILVTGGSSDNPGGHVVMNGGTIIGNVNPYRLDNDCGGGVTVDAMGLFDMTDGSISANYSKNGGGVALHGNGRFNQTGGTISLNNADAGGAVSVRGHGVFEMKGGVISGNSAQYGGGIYLQRDGEPQASTGYIALSDGEISDNMAAEKGGGVYFEEGIFKLSGNPVITDNKAKISDGTSTAPDNVAMANDKKITIAGKLTNTTPIGIVRNEGIFTTGLKDNGTADCFVSNSERLGVYPVVAEENNGEAQLGTDEWKSLQYALLSVQDGDTINVRDFDFDEDYKITAGKDDTCLDIWGAEDGDDPKKVTLNLNGITLDRGLSNGEAAEDGCVLNLRTILDLTIIGTSVDNHVGTITGGNSSDSWGGGGIRIGTYVSLTLQDGVITGNKATKAGGGIFVSGTLTLKGAPKITGNQTGESDNNVYLTTNNNQNATITVVDNLENDKGEKAEVGVTTEAKPAAETPVAITGKVPNPYSVASRFSSDLPEYSTVQRKAVVYLAVPVTVTYDKNSGEAQGKMDPQKMFGGLVDTLASNEFTWSKHSFKEWNTQKDGKGTSYKDGAEVTLTKDTTLYAQWENNATPTPKPTPTPTPKPGNKVSGMLLAKITAKGSNGLALTWNKVTGAKGYDIYFDRCNGKDSTKGMKKVKTVKAGKALKWTKTGLKKKTAYKAYVKAYTVKNGKKKYIKTSPLTHSYTSGASKKYSNAKALTVNKTKVVLKKGKTFKIKTKITKVKKNKKLMPKTHVKTVRYMTSNKKVATVSAGGKITAKAKGTCFVYAYTHNCIYKKITVTVK